MQILFCFLKIIQHLKSYKYIVFCISWCLNQLLLGMSEKFVGSDGLASLGTPTPWLQWQGQLRQTSTWHTSGVLVNVNTLRLRQNGPHFADAIFRCISMSEKFCILITISLKFLPKGAIDNTPALSGVYTKFSGRLPEEPFPWLIQKFPCI